MLIFFFQAEDGIRDFHVTGVQTCALPISNVQIQQATSQSAQLGYNAESFSLEEIHQLLELMKAASEALSSDHDRDAIRTEIASRSEERRVGKEGRSWG